jgi:hypothetical protein
LEEQNERLTKENVELKFRRDQARAQVVKMRNLEPPMKKDFNALR